MPYETAARPAPVNYPSPSTDTRDYETAASRGSRNFPESWGVPQGRAYSPERRAWIEHNMTMNPRFKMEQLRAGERRRLRDEIEALDARLRARGITPPPLDDF